jgi:N-acetylneuraminic acid mutarotase
MNVPSGRFGHSAIWTGTELIVWGGVTALSTVTNTGARYNPATDAWTAMSTTDAPAGRYVHSAVWTGTDMIVWGGGSGSSSPVAGGGRYNPTTNTWNPIAMSTTNAPSPALYSVAQWTGSRMLVFGGEAAGSALSNQGGLYDPIGNTWTPTPTVGAPTARSQAAAAVLGGRFVVWGGSSAAGKRGDGHALDVEANSWEAISLSAAPDARDGMSYVSNGTQLVVWGGRGQASSLAVNTGGRFTPPPILPCSPVCVSPAVCRAGQCVTPDSWTTINTTNAPPAADGDETGGGVWTGTRLLVWGGRLSGGGVTNAGGIYDPRSDSWNPITTSGAPTGRVDHSVVWTGSRMVVWGGTTGTGNTNTGGRYDPDNNSWSDTSTDSAPGARFNHAAVWTGNRMIVWGGLAPDGNSALNTGGIYDPLGNAWTPTTTSDAPSARGLPVAVWTGTQLLIWGGYAVPGGCGLTSGGRYDPQANSWTPISTTNAPPAYRTQRGVWTGRRLVVFGGQVCAPGASNEGGIYDPVTDTWVRTSMTGAPSARSHHSMVWTGTRVIVWGGNDNFAGGSLDHFNDGFLLDPLDNTWTPTSMTGAPTARDRLAGAVWTGTQMLIWGGLNASGQLNTGGVYTPP